jgi:site-specific DNA recombinase
MHGKERKGITYYACCYRIAYGDTAAHAVGHGKWQYIREDALLPHIDAFFHEHIFGPHRVKHFRNQHATLTRELGQTDQQERERLQRELADTDRRVALQLQAIEAGVDPTLVRSRLEKLQQQRDNLTAASASLTPETTNAIDEDEACAILDALPNLSEALAAADPELRRRVYEAFGLTVTLDKNTRQIQIRALISSALTPHDNLKQIVANESIAGAGFEPATSGL